MNNHINRNIIEYSDNGVNVIPCDYKKGDKIQDVTHDMFGGKGLILN